VCIRWVPHSLIFEHKTERKAISFELLVCFDTEGETFFSQIFTDETWVHHFEPEREKKKTICGMAPFSISLEEKKFKKFPSLGKVTVTLFWNWEGAVLENAVLIGQTINCDAYIRT
jgi:hypothetical protein